MENITSPVFKSSQKVFMAVRADQNTIVGLGRGFTVDRVEQMIARLRAGGRLHITYDWYGCPNVCIYNPWLPLALLGPRVRVTPQELYRLKDAARSRHKPQAAA